MKRRITFLLAALLLTCGLSWAQQITWTAADQGYENAQVIQSVDFDDYVSAEFFKGTNNNEPKYYTTGNAIRCYGGNYFTVTSDYPLTEIVLGFSSGEGTNAITTDCGDYSDGTWTGSANEVTFTIGGTSGHRRIASFVITYTEGGTPAPSITASNVEIDYDATSGTIEYTVNNPVEGGVMTATTEAEWLTFGDEGTDFTCEVNEGAARSANVTLIYTYDTDQTATKNVIVTQGSNPNVPGTENNPYTVAQAIDAIIAGEGTQNVYATGIVSAIVTDYNSQYGNITFDIVDETGDEAFVRAYRCGGSEAADVTVGDVAVIYGNLTYYNNSVYEFTQGCELVSLTHPVVTTPTVIVTPLTVNAPAEGGDGTLTVTYENITEVLAEVYFCDAEGEATTYDWITAEINNENNVYYVIDANNGEARTAYFKVWAYDDEFNEVYSDLITVNQAEYVAPALDYATLPFEFNGGKADIEVTDGLTQEGLGNDYNGGNNATTPLRFDGTGDWLLLHFNERPGTLTFDITGNGFSDGTFTVQTSEDGETYTVLETYTELGTTQSEEFTNLGEDVRYIKWIYTNKSSGNVGLGNIALAEYTEPAHTIVIDPDSFEIGAEGGENGFEYTVNWSEGGMAEGFEFYDAPDGETIDQPEWIIIVEQTGENEDYHFTVFANEGEARSAYFKAYTDDEGTTLYSNLVTINQAAAPQQYTLTVEPFENLELITFVNDEMVMEGDGEIQVTNGNQIMLSIVANEGYVMETLMVNGVNHVNDIAEDYTYTFEMPAENVTISATAVEDVPPTPGEWVMVSLNELTEDDVFVIVGVYDEDESSFAMPNNGTNAPSAVDVTMVGNTLSGDIDDNLKWNLSIGENGYTFYPNGETETWLYCTNTNNGVRVGINENNVFTMTPEGYLFHNATSRYIGIYNRQDWRCYTSINNNIKDQTFAFYKRVDEGSLVTHTLDIEGYGESDGGYYLIASPVSMVRPTADNGFLTEAYDLYYFDQAQEQEWRNYEAKHFNIAAGKGYLYASQENTTLTFTGVPYQGNGVIKLAYTEGGDFPGWNLVGNPFGQTAYIGRAFYIMNSTIGELIASESNTVEPKQGFFVIAAEDGEELEISTTAPAEQGGKIVMNVSNGRSSVIDRATVRFGEGRTLPKFMLNDENTKIYFTEGNEEFAVVRSIDENATPVSFHAAENGTYTLSINAENVEMEYLHLLDNMTGADVDLLATPSYTFEARTSDYANRFKLVYATTTDVNENNVEPFAFFNGSEWVINNEGEATLQVIDINGRMLSNETVNGNANVNINATSGIYMLRLVNGESVKTQKVVVK